MRKNSCKKIIGHVLPFARGTAGLDDLCDPGIDSESRVIITSRGTTYKVKHIQRDPRVSMLIFGEQYSGSKFVQIHGTAEIIEQPEAMDTLIYWYKQVRGEHKNWDEYRDTMKKQKRVIIRVNIEKVGPQQARER